MLMRMGKQILLRPLGIIIIAIVWQIAGTLNESPALPPLSQIMATLFTLIRDGTYNRHINASLQVVLLGIGFASAFGFILGVLMFRYDNFKTSVQPVIESIRGVPALTLFPLLIVLFGLGTFSRVFVIFWTAYPAVVLSTINSLNIDTSVVDAARTSGSGEWRIIYSIRIPMATQGIITGLRIGVGGGWIGLVAAEMLGATRGLGHFLLWSAQSFQFDRVYATIIVIAFIGGMMNWVLLFIQKLLLKVTE